MKYVKITVISGMFFIFMQFAATALFNTFLEIARTNSLPVEELASMQMKIMNVVYYALIVSGILFILLLCLIIRNTFKQPKASENAQ